MDRSHVMLATALVALRFKPPDQSISSIDSSWFYNLAYLIDLRSKFPLFVAHGKEDERNDSGAANNMSTIAHWRAHALALERNYAALKELYEAEKIKNLCSGKQGLEPEAWAPTTGLPNENDRATITPCSESSRSLGIDKVMPVASTSNSMTGKKGNKKKQADHISRGYLDKPKQNSRIKQQYNDTRAAGKPIIPEDSILFQPIDDLIKLASSPRYTTIDAALLHSASCRVIIAMGKLLHLTIVYPSTSDCPLRHLSSLKAILPKVLPITLAALNGSPGRVDDPLGTILSHLTSNIFQPLISNLFSVSLAFLSGHVSHLNLARTKSQSATSPTSLESRTTHPSKGEPTAVIADIRPGMLDLFQTCFDLVNQYIKLHGAMATTLALQIIRQIKQVLTVSRCSCGPDVIDMRNKSLDTRAGEDCGATVTGTEDFAAQCENMKRLRAVTHLEGRTKRLAQKDTLWYLCALLHVICPSFMDATNDDAITQKLRTDVVNALIDLASNIGGKCGVGGVGRPGQNGHASGAASCENCGGCSKALDICGEKRDDGSDNKAKNLASGSQQGGIETKFNGAHMVRHNDLLERSQLASRGYLQSSQTGLGYSAATGSSHENGALMSSTYINDGGTTHLDISCLAGGERSGPQEQDLPQLIKPELRFEVDYGSTRNTPPNLERQSGSTWKESPHDMKSRDDRRHSDWVRQQGRRVCTWCGRLEFKRHEVEQDGGPFAIGDLSWVDEQTARMVLGVVERYWLCTL